MDNKIINGYIGLLIDGFNNFSHICRGNQTPEQYYGEEVKILEDFLHLDWDTIQKLYSENKWGE